MTTTCASFFTLPELIAYLAPFLASQDLIQLTRTNHSLNTLCTPFLWTSLDLLHSNTIATRLLASPEGLQAFRNNVNTIRAVYWKPDFSWYYFNALLAHLNNHNNSAPAGQGEGNNNEAIISTEALTHVEWGRMETPSPFPVEPLPPLRRLTFLKALTDDIGNHSPSYHSGAHALQTFWLVRLNSSTLVHLKLLTLDMESHHVVRDLCRTISGLLHLRTLELDTLTPNHLSFQHLAAIVFSCPASLVELIFKSVFATPSNNGLPDPVGGDWDFEQGPLTLREEPLYQLKTLQFPALFTGYQSPFLCSILEHCPALEHLRIPSLVDSKTSQKVAETIGRHCPRLHHLSMPMPFQDNKGVTVMSIMEAIPPQQLRTFSLYVYLDDHPNRMMAAWTRHSETLQTIELMDCRRLKSSTLRTALMNCRTLERLEVTEFYPSKSCILLEDAVVERWASTRIRSLSIAVKMSSDGGNPAYLTDPSMETWTDQDHAHWEMLGRFYTQIGSLTELEYLDLRSAASTPSPTEIDPNATQETPLESTCLPGLLALDDSSSGQIGYLSKLSGLIKLKELRGSIVCTKKEDEGEETRVTMSKREVEWFVDNLPALKVAHFLPRGGRHGNTFVFFRAPEVLEPLRWHRPELILSPSPFDNDYI
ncbi:hypothetical protein BGX23_007422 [Mortierella sp. AD031]|nr:hypothetical protein BGX23_007422 [Mortierella sp. AD031]